MSRELGPELRDRIRRQLDWQTWGRLDRLESSARRQAARGVEPLLDRVARLLPHSCVFTPLIVHLPDEYVIIGNDVGAGFNLRSSVRPRAIEAPGLTDVLTAMAPIFRRAVDQSLPVTMDLLYKDTTVASYIGTAVLDPTYAIFLGDLQPTPASPREAFLARFSLLADRLGTVGPLWGVGTESWSVKRYVGSNCIWSKGRFQGIWEDWVRSAGEEYRENMTLRFFFRDTDWSVNIVIAEFNSPSYNLAGSFRNFL